MTPSSPAKPKARAHRRAPRPPAAAAEGPAARLSPGTRREPTQARARELVAAILEAAACILEEDGYLAASTNAIARRAGVSVGSLYQYFSCREAIFGALVARHRQRIHPRVEAALVRLGDGRSDPPAVLSDLLKDLLEAHAERPALMRALDTELGPIVEAQAKAEEAQGAEAATRLLASRVAAPPGEALAGAWLAAEFTAYLGRKLAHAPPPWLDLALAEEAFARAVRALLSPRPSDPGKPPAHPPPRW